MRVGLDAYTIREFGFTPSEMIEYAEAHGFDGIQFEHLRRLSPTLDLGELRDIRALAESKGMYVNISVSECNPIVAEMEPEALAARLAEEVAVAAQMGWREVRSNCGVLRHRNTHPVKWPLHLAACQKVLELLRPCLLEHGVRVNLETHSDSTTWELLAIVEAVGPDAVGITLDTGNLLLHGEWPVAAVRRVAPHVHLTHAKDGRLYWDENGYFRQGCPPGSGVVEWEAVISTLAAHHPELDLSIEDHKVLNYAPIFTEEWHAGHPDLSAAELSQLVRLANQCETRLAAGLLPPVEEYESVPFVQQAEERLAQGRDYLKGLLADMGLYG